MDDCFVCRKHRGETRTPGGPIYEDALVYAGHADIPDGHTTVYLGYLLVEPKRHAPGLADLTDAEAQAVGLQGDAAQPGLEGRCGGRPYLRLCARPPCTRIYICI